MSTITHAVTLPGDTTLPSSEADIKALIDLGKGTYKYDVADYFRKPAQSNFQLSPNGDYCAYRMRDERGKNHLMVKTVATGESHLVMAEKEDLIRGYFWASNSRLVYMKDKGGDENYHVLAVDVDGSNAIDLTPFDGVRAMIIEPLRELDDYMVITMNKNNPQVFEPYKLNINNGDLEQLIENTDTQNPIAEYIIDKTGQLRGYAKQRDGVSFDYYYLESDKPVLKFSCTWKDRFSFITFDYSTENEHDALVVSNLNSDKATLQRYDFLKNEIIETLFEHTTYDAGGVSISRLRDYTIDYYYYEGERLTYVPKSDFGIKIIQKCSAEFPGKQFSIVSKTKDEKQLLIYVNSDKLAGIYYTYNADLDEFTELFNLIPQLEPEDMAEMRPISFTARDGMRLYGYLTIPKDADLDNKVPLIVNPHGGPYGPRDEWGFNPETQLFASRGYATLQLNYRGSGGYGKDFFLAGSKQIGRAMLNDLEDGVEHVISSGFINSEKVAIYGGSYGGLATLGSLVKTPQKYTCGVDFVGVSNLFTFMESIPPYWKPYLDIIHAQWYNPNDPVELEIMKAVSPALNVDKIEKPLFVIQGANDPRVNIDESDQIVRSLRDRGYDVPYMVKYNEGHGFAHENNRIEMYRAMLGFFAQHLN